MSTIRSILLHLDGSQHTEARVRLAQALAEQLDATVAATYAVMPLMPPSVAAEAAAIVAMVQDLDDARRQHAREAFEALRAGPRVNWRELGPGPMVARFTHQALTADLVVLGQHDPADHALSGVPADFVQTVVVESGRPTIVVPYVGAAVPVGRTVLVAWKPTRESARALSAALPLLRHARHVHVAGWDAQPRDVQHLLLRHGIDATYHHEAAAGGDVGEYMLSRADELGADLLVMGCYGHSRARELVLGGASRTVLHSMTLPVLMTH